MRRTRTIPTDAASQLGPQFAVLRLRSWPDVCSMPPDLAPDMARICALLAIRPTGAPLIPHLLGLPRERVEQVVAVLHTGGYLNDGTSPSTRTAPSGESGETLSAKGVLSPVVSFLDRFRKKLLPAGAR